MPIIFGDNNWLATVRQESTVFTDGYALCVLGVTASDVDGPGEIAATVFGSWRDHILPLQASDTVLTRVEVVNDTQYGAASGTAEGGKNVSMLPQNSAVLLAKRTSVRGRRGRGRMFIPNAADEELVFSDGLLDTSFRSTFQEAASNFFEQLEVNDVSLSIPQNQAPDQVTPPILPWPLVTSLQVDAMIGTQRRRMRR